MSPQELREVVSENIRAAAKRKHIPISHLADRATVSRTQLWDVLRLKKATTTDTLAKLADVLGVEPHVLLARQSTNTKRRAKRGG